MEGSQKQINEPSNITQIHMYKHSRRVDTGEHVTRFKCFKGFLWSGRDREKREYIPVSDSLNPRTGVIYVRIGVGNETNK